VTAELYVNSQGRLRVEHRHRDASEHLSSIAFEKIERAFSGGEGAGLLHLATVESKAALAPSLAFAHRYFTQLCHLNESECPAGKMLVALPEEPELERVVLDAPPNGL